TPRSTGWCGRSVGGGCPGPRCRSDDPLPSLSLTGRAEAASGNRQSVHDPLELVSDPRRVGSRGGADAADLASGVEIVRAVQGDVLGRLLADEEERQPELGGVLFCCAAAHTLDAAVVRDVLAALAGAVEDLAPFDLPALRDILDVVQALPDQLICDRRHRH